MHVPSSTLISQDEALLTADPGIELESLAELPRWVAWRAEGPKARKVPYSPASGRKADSTSPATWGTRPAAEARARSLGGGAAVGVMLGELRDGSGLSLIGVDLDSCRDPATGTVEPWAREIMRRVRTYAEVSPSGTGIKLFGLVPTAELPALRATMGEGGPPRWGRKWTRGTGRHGPAVELYTGQRYFAVTDDWEIEAPGELRQLRPAVLELLIREENGRTAPPGSSAKPKKPRDPSRSGVAWDLAGRMKRAGATYEAFVEAVEADPLLAEWAAEGGERQLKRAWKRSPPTPAELADQSFDVVPDEPGAPGRLAFLSPGECGAAPSRGYVLKGMLAPGDVGCIFGAPGGGKSLIAPHVGYMVAQGEPAFGMRTRPGGVLYVAAEDAHGMRGRIAALKLAHGDAPAFALVEGVADLLRPRSPDLAALKAAVAERKPALIFLDTLAMSFPGLEENTAEGMGRVVKVARELTEHGAAVVLVHHDTKAGEPTPRGHGLLNGALDMALQLMPADDSGIICARLTKNRNGPCDRHIAFCIDVRELGRDEDGDAITAALVRELTPGRRRQAERLPGAEQAALDVLTGLATVQADGRTAAREADWRRACMDGRGVSAAELPKSRRKAMERAAAGLFRKGRVEFHDGWVSTPMIEEDWPDDDADHSGIGMPAGDLSSDANG